MTSGSVLLQCGPASFSHSSGVALRMAMLDRPPLLTLQIIILLFLFIGPLTFSLSFCWNLPCSVLHCTLLLSCRFRSMAQTIRELRGSKLLLGNVPQLEAPVMPARPVPAVAWWGEEEEQVEPPPRIAPQHSCTIRSSSKRLWKGLQQVPLIPSSCHCMAQIEMLHTVRYLTRSAWFP